MIFSNKTYDRLRWIAGDVLPALGVFYSTLSIWWHLPYCAQIVGTLSGLTVLITALLKQSSKNYEGDGAITIDVSEDDLDVCRIDLSTELPDLAEKDMLMLKVKKPSHMKE